MPRSLLKGIRYPEKVRLPKRTRHEFDADQEVADESGWDCNRGEAKNGAQSPIVPKARRVRNDGSGHDIVGDDFGKVIERRDPHPSSCGSICQGMPQCGPPVRKERP